MSLDFKPGWCNECQNTGYVDCHCGGDLCICENYGEYPCPVCGGESGYDDDCDDVTDDEIISHAEARAWRSVAKAIRGVIREIDE